MIGTLLRDLIYALRQLRQTPIVSGVALLSLALGIGANVAIFSLVNALILKSLPVANPQQLTVMGRLDQRGAPGAASTSATHPQFEYLRDHQDFLAGVTAVGFARFDLGTGNEARPVPGLYVDGRFLDVLGVTPALGRRFTTDDDRVGGGPGGPVAIASYGYWQREHGGDPAILGRTVTLDGHPFTIVGVTPRDFHGIRVGFSFDIMIPLGSERIIRGGESSLGRRTSWWLTVVARLEPGQTREDAEARMRGFQAGMREATIPTTGSPEDQADYFTEPIVFEPAAAGISSLRTRYAQPLYVLLGIVGLVLTIACVNMANLLLAQSVARRRELAVRLSLGAGRTQIVRQLLVESLTLSALGAAAGLAVAAWGSRALVGLLSTRTSQVALDLAMDGRVFAFTAAVGVLTGLLFGVVPAIRGTRISPADTLRDHARGIVAGGSRLSIGHGLVALQVALSFVLVLGSALFGRTFVDLATQGMGFDARGVMLATVDLRRTGAAPETRLRLFEQVRDAIVATPGISAAAASFVTPVSGSMWAYRVRVPDGPPPPRSSSLFNGVTPGYFQALGTPLLAGRDFSAGDTAGRTPVVVVNEAFARAYFGVENPVGRSFYREGGSGASESLVEVVGLVSDAKYQSLRETPQPTVYGAMAQQDRISTSVRMVIKTAGNPWDAREALVSAVAGVSPDIVIDLKGFDEDLGAALQQERLIASLSAFFGGLALVLAALGLYGVMSYSVSRRRNEIGIRMAVGAEPAAVMRLVLRHVAWITAAGLLMGAVTAAASGRFIDALLFNVKAGDATTMAAVAAVLAAAAVLAGYVPARRAARIDPMTALRVE
ncbi:MAG: ABC transporter permease [Vicinamibacterales bacterium]